mgnify:CR=1 FL=1|tara:strand:- start:482 stop:658 length:177 start_codon:yes stop_codon:yes gene_type:complete
MNTTYHVYNKDDNGQPVGDMINLDEEQLCEKLKDRINKYNEITIVKVEEPEDMCDASY